MIRLWRVQEQPPSLDRSVWFMSMCLGSSHHSETRRRSNTCFMSGLWPKASVLAFMPLLLPQGKTIDIVRGRNSVHMSQLSPNVRFDLPDQITVKLGRKFSCSIRCSSCSLYCPYIGSLIASWWILRLIVISLRLRPSGKYLIISNQEANKI